MLSVPEGQIKEILRPETSEVLLLITQDSVSKVKQLASPAEVSQIH